MAITLSPPKKPLHWLQIYRLYLKAFPFSERKPFIIISSMYRKGRTDLWCIRENDRFLGFASTVNGDSLVLLDYLAIDPRCRGEGIGSVALRQFLSAYPDRGVFAEIEDTSLPGADQPTRLRRKQFYLNCGMEELQVTAQVFGVNMELLGKNCSLDFAGYKRFYKAYYAPWAARHVLPRK